jgi:hypothetical protein
MYVSFHVSVTRNEVILLRVIARMCDCVRYVLLALPVVMWVINMRSRVIGNLVAGDRKHIWYAHCVWHDSLLCVTWLTPVCDMTHSCVWHDPLLCVTWLLHMCGVTHSHVCQCDIFTTNSSCSNVFHWYALPTYRPSHLAPWPCAWVMSHGCMRHVTRLHASCHTVACVMSRVWIE